MPEGVCTDKHGNSPGPAANATIGIGGRGRDPNATLGVGGRDHDPRDPFHPPRLALEAPGLIQ